MTAEAPRPPEQPATHVHVLEAAGRAALSAVPLAGGALVELFEAVTTHGRAQRMQQWMEDVADMLQRHGVRIDELAGSEGYLDAIGPATRAAIETAQEEKRRALAVAVVNATTMTDLDADERAILLDLVVRLTPMHLRLLRILDDPDSALDAAGQKRKTFYSGGSRSELIGQVAPDLLSRVDLLGHVADSLEREALARPQMKMMTSGEGVYQRGSTDLGRQLLEFITEPSVRRASTEP